MSEAHTLSRDVQITHIDDLEDGGRGGGGWGQMTLGWMCFEDVRGTHATASYRDNMVWPIGTGFPHCFEHACRAQATLVQSDPI